MRHRIILQIGSTIPDARFRARALMLPDRNEKNRFVQLIMKSINYFKVNLKPSNSLHAEHPLHGNGKIKQLHVIALAFFGRNRNTHRRRCTQINKNNYDVFAVQSI